MGLPTSIAITPTTPISPLEETKSQLSMEPSSLGDLSGSSDSEPEAELIGPLMGKEELIPISEMPVCPTDHSQWKEIVNTVIPCDVDALFTMLFTNSKFFMDLHTARKTFGMYL